MLLKLVKDLEGKSDEARLRIIRSRLEAWRVPYQLHRYQTGTNLFVKAKTDSFVGIGSHYDVVPGSPGANDNASAIAVALELVRRTRNYSGNHLGLQFFFFDEEENGLKGSGAYLEEHGYRGMKGLFNLEMVGMGDRLAFWPLDAQSEGALLEALERQCGRMQIPTGRYDEILTRTADHVSFRRAGLTEAFTITCISGKDVAVAQHYYRAQEFDVDAQTLHEILAEAPLFQHYHRSTDTSEHLRETALQMTANALWETYLALDQRG
ncbi:MAG: M28 family peptidase [Ferruginibacter sp.]|nr:M28 family peptidase [Cytophagales bacterium]